jgi:hypothetical protein
VFHPLRFRIGNNCQVVLTTCTKLGPFCACFDMNFSMLRLLQNSIEGDCMMHGTLRADVWRYFVLCVECTGESTPILDCIPTGKFWNATTGMFLIEGMGRTPSAITDGLFVVEQYVLSPPSFGVPCHSPSSIDCKRPGRVSAPHVTGARSLHQVFPAFAKKSECQTWNLLGRETNV